MGISEAVNVCLKQKYATFAGRAARSEYWWFNLAAWLAIMIPVGIGAAAMDFNTGEPGAVSIAFFILAGVVFLGMLMPMWAVGVRRFHDRNLSGWWYLACALLANVPYVGVLFGIGSFVICVLRGTDGENKFGPDPLKPYARAEVFA